MVNDNRFQRVQFQRVQGIFTGLGILAGLFLFVGTSSAHADTVLVEFYSPHCQPCEAMRPVIDAMESQGVPVRRVDVTRERLYAERYGIRQTPTYVFLSSGRESTRLVGAQTPDAIRRALMASGQSPVRNTNARRDTSSNDVPRTRLAALQSNFPNSERRNDRNRQDPFAATASNPPPRTRLSASSSEVMPSDETADAVERTRAATVRIKVHDDRGYGVGTGTIVDRHGEEFLVLTCGHLFRETGKDSRVEVELFAFGQIKSVPGQVIDYDADDRDVALVAIRPGIEIEPVQIAGPGSKRSVGEPVFSFGCDHGENPTRRDTTITAIDKINQHLGRSNFEIAVAPVTGRSGGGLFDRKGRLIGICNAADHKNDVGIYAGPGEILWQMSRVQLQHLCEDRNDPSPIAAQSNPSIRLAAAESANSFGRSQNQSRINPAMTRSGDGEMIVIIRDRNGGEEVHQIDRPSEELLQMIRRR